jgi:hypothetical protein
VAVQARFSHRSAHGRPLGQATRRHALTPRASDKAGRSADHAASDRATYRAAPPPRAVAAALTIAWNLLLR